MARIALMLDGNLKLDYSSMVGMHLMRFSERVKVG